MLRNGVNYKGLYGNLRTCLGVKNKEYELNKKCLSLSPWCFGSVFVAYFGRFSVILVGFGFAVFLSLSLSIYIYILGIHIERILTANLKSTESC